MEPVDSTSTTKPRRQQRLWIGFFLLLATLGGAAVGIPIVYNLGLQLKPDDELRARQLWDEKGPRDYDLELMRRENRQETADEYRIKVRGGQVTAVESKTEGILLVDETVGLALGPVIRVQPVENLARFTIPGLFDEIESNIRQDAEVPAGKHKYAAGVVRDERGWPADPLRSSHRRHETARRMELEVDSGEGRGAMSACLLNFRLWASCRMSWVPCPRLRGHDEPWQVATASRARIRPRPSHVMLPRVAADDTGSSCPRKRGHGTQLNYQMLTT